MYSIAALAHRVSYAKVEEEEEDSSGHMVCTCMQVDLMPHHNICCMTYYAVLYIYTCGIHTNTMHDKMMLLQ